MTEEELKALISKQESESLDYKSAGYVFPDERHKFVKDLLALANTPREESAFVVFGIDWSPEKGSVVVGLNQQLDDSELQDQFTSARIQPRPRFTYYPLRLDGRQVGVLEVPITHGGPFTAVDDYAFVKNTAKIQGGAVYYRRGTQNARATGGDLSRINSWFASGIRGDSNLWDTDAWRQFLDGVRRFEPGRCYILAADCLRGAPGVPLDALGLQPWRAVIDFDPESDVAGLLSQVAATLKTRRVIHRSVDENDTVAPDPATHWYFARGLEGRRDSVQLGNHVSWLKTHKRPLTRQLERIANAISPMPVLVLAIWTDADSGKFLRTLIEEMHAAFGESVEVVVVSETARLASAVQENGGTHVHMSFKDLFRGLEVLHSKQQGAGRTGAVLPSQSGAPLELQAEDALWLSEDLELVHLGRGVDGSDDAREYRIGGEISWRNLNLKHDCERDIAPAVLQRVTQDLQSRQVTRVNLYHAPGAGGTSVGRRVAWDVHRTFPVAILRALTSDATAEKVGRVFGVTGHSVLVVIDGGSHAERDIDDLYNRLRANNTPAVLLQVLRRFDRQKVGPRQFWLDDRLSDEESDRFRNVYSQAVPARKLVLDAIAGRHGRTRSAFFFGLAAFEDDYRGLRQHVAARIPSEVTETQKRILVYIAIAYYYGQQPVPAQTFAMLLGLPMSKKLVFRDAFAGPSSRVLELLVETADDRWRASHQLVALQILRKELTPSNVQAAVDVWRQRLSQWSKEFIDFCRAEGHPQSERLLELVRRVFIYRDNVEVLGTERASLTRYAQLIEDIPSPQGRVEVLQYLTARFPGEAHFHSHLARLLSQGGEYKRALECADYAIELQPGDQVLHHMRGMVHRQQMRMSIDARADLSEVTRLAKLAAESFSDARYHRPEAEHSYVSEVQTLISLVDYAGKGTRDVVREVLAQSRTDPFIRTALERADELLDQVRHLYGGEKPSHYVGDCRARLARFYGDYERALQAWDNLLARQDVDRPPIRRQIVWTLLRRRGEVWNALRNNELRRVTTLLEENLQEDSNDSTSLRLWLRAVRLPPVAASLDHVIERVSYWKANTNSWDAAYYLYVLHMLRALQGSTQGAADAERALDECRGLTRFRRDRTRSFEWLGNGDGIGSLVHQSRLGEWEGDFWGDTCALARVEGRIKSIDGPQKGVVEVRGAVDAFFVPARAGFYEGRDANVAVDFYLGFSYDGPRAWDVRRSGKDSPELG